ncbi:MAG: hypothetical protein SVY15_05850 [Halobacteriota archaeon]|nr:hypothetical protein [Halobacteriota archaeon]
MEEGKRHTRVLISSFAICYLFTRLAILAFIFLQGGGDIPYYVRWGSSHLQNPFITSTVPFLAESIFVIPVGLSRFLSLDPLLVTNLFVFSFDLGILFLLYKIARKFYDLDASMLILLAFSLPTTYTYTLLEGQNEIIICFFFMLFVYSYLYKRWITFAVSYSLIVLSLIFPIILLPFILELIERKRLFITTAISSFIFSGFIYLVSPQFFGDLVSRGSTGMRVGKLTFISPYILLMMRDWYEPVRLLAFAIFLVALFLFLYYLPLNIKREVRFLFTLVLFNLCFMVFYPAPYHHYLVWTFPIMFLIIPFRFLKRRFLYQLILFNIPWIVSFILQRTVNSTWILENNLPHTSLLMTLSNHIIPITVLLLVIVYINHYLLYRENYRFYDNFIPVDNIEEDYHIPSD